MLPRTRFLQSAFLSAVALIYGRTEVLHAAPCNEDCQLFVALCKSFCGENNIGSIGCSEDFAICQCNGSSTPAMFCS